MRFIASKLFKVQLMTMSLTRIVYSHIVLLQSERQEGIVAMIYIQTTFQVVWG